MHTSRKLLALLRLAESSEAGRSMVLRVIIEAAMLARADVDESLEDKTVEELLHALSHPEEWPDECPWINAFEHRLAQVALPGLQPAVSWN